VRDQQGLRTSDPELAAAWRDAVADALEASLGLGMVVAAFDPGSEAAAPAYVLARPEHMASPASPVGEPSGGSAS
jgi:predicted GNAT superfamily acetyltransferase